MIPPAIVPAAWRPALLAIAAGLAIVAGVAWWKSHNAAEQRVGYERAAAEYREKLDQQTAAARLREQGWFLNAERASNERTETEKKLAVYRAAADAADDRLRRSVDDWRRRLSDATVATCREAADTAATLLGECGREYRRVAAAADGHLADVEQCESAWPR